MHYICTIKNESKPANVGNGALAHLARARHWQCRGDEFESHTLHKLSKLIIQILEFRAFKDFFILFSFPHSFILIQRGRKKQLPPAKKESADCIILLNLLINGKRSDTASCTAPPCQYMKKQIPTIAHNGPYSQSCF